MLLLRYCCIIFCIAYFCNQVQAQKKYIEDPERRCLGEGMTDCYGWMHYPYNSFRIDLADNLILSEDEKNYIWAEVSLIDDFWRPVANSQPLCYEEMRKFKLLKLHYPKNITLSDTFSVQIIYSKYERQKLNTYKLFKYNENFDVGHSLHRDISDMVPDTPVLIRISYKNGQIKKQHIDSTAFLSYEYIGDADTVGGFVGPKCLGYWSYQTYLPWLFADKKDGKYHFLLANAFLIECHFKNNQLDKYFIVYSLDGHLVGQKKYKKGKLLSAFLYYYTDESEEVWAEWNRQHSPIPDFQTRNLNPVLRRSIDKNKVNELVFMDKIPDSLISLDTTKKVLVYKPFQPLVDSLWDWNLYNKMSEHHPIIIEERNDEEEENKTEQD